MCTKLNERRRSGEADSEILIFSNHAERISQMMFELIAAAVIAVFVNCAYLIVWGFVRDLRESTRLQTSRAGSAIRTFAAAALAYNPEMRARYWFFHLRCGLRFWQ
jgi:hypothetical protein